MTSQPVGEPNSPHNAPAPAPLTPAGGQPAPMPAPDSIMNSPFAKLFPNATAEQLTQMMNNYIKQIIDQIKKDEARAKATARKMKEQIEEEGS